MVTPNFRSPKLGPLHGRKHQFLPLAATWFDPVNITGTDVGLTEGHRRDVVISSLPNNWGPQNSQKNHILALAAVQCELASLKVAWMWIYQGHRGNVVTTP
jgi:hypothetical protein